MPSPCPIRDYSTNVVTSELNDVFIILRQYLTEKGELHKLPGYMRELGIEHYMAMARLATTYTPLDAKYNGLANSAQPPVPRAHLDQLEELKAD